MKKGNNGVIVPVGTSSALFPHHVMSPEAVNCDKLTGESQHDAIRGGQTSLGPSGWFVLLGQG